MKVDPKVIIITGASGSGKTFLLSHLKDNPNLGIKAIKKYTSRSARCYEDKSDAVDLVFNQNVEDVKKYLFSYPYKGEQYGIDAEQIDSELIKGYHVAVIVRNFDTIKKIKEHYSNCYVLYLHSAKSSHDLENVLKRQGREQTVVNQSLSNRRKIFDDYIHTLYDNIVDFLVLNYYDESFLAQVFYFLRKVGIHDESFY